MKKRYQISILLIFICVVIGYHLFGYIGHYGYDDLHYAKLANDFKNGIVDYHDHYSYRTSIIVFTSWSYSLLGISDTASSIPSIIISILIIWIVYYLLKNNSLTILIIGLSLTTFSNWFLFYSDKLMPDIYVALSILLSLFIVHQYKYNRKRENTILYSCLFSFMLLFGLMSKETIVLIIPVLFYFAFVDLLLKRDIKFWVYSLISGLVILIIYLAVIRLLTGDVLKRFEAIAGNSYLNLCSYDKQSLMILLKRITYGFFKLLISQAMVTGFIFVLAYIISRKSVDLYKINDSFSYWIMASLLLFLSSNFMTISLTSYSPMCLDPRHYLFLIPVVSIPASTIINDFLEKKTLKIQILSIIALISIFSLFLPDNTFLHLYFPLFILFVTYLFIRPDMFYQKIFVALFAFVLLNKPYTMIKYAQKVNYWKQKDIFNKYILNTRDSCMVITNDVQKRLGEYYSKFVEHNKIEFLNYREFRNDTTDTRKKLLFNSWYTAYLSNLDYNDLPYFAKNISSRNNLIFQDKELNIEIYDMKEFLTPDMSGRTLLYTKNNFEEISKNFNQDQKDISTEIKYEGKKSIQVNEFSSTFEYNIDSLDIKDINQLTIQCNLYVYFEDKTTAKLVISIENGDVSYVWNGIEINKYIKAYSNWWSIKHEITMEKKKIKDNSKIKIYVWNLDKHKAFIDNFEIKIIGN